MSPPSPPPPSSVESLLDEVGWVRALAARLAEDTARAEDLAQRTLVAALERRPGGDRPLRPWLARVLRRLARHERRGDARRLARERLAARGEVTQHEPSALLEQLEEQQRLARSVAALPEPYRTVILRRYYRGETPAEIAAATGRSAATVRSQAARGLEQLRGALEERVDGDRRAALAVLGVAAAADAGSTSPVSASLGTLTMATTTKALAAAALIAATVLVARSLDPGGPETPGEPALAASADPDGSESGRADAPTPDAALVARSGVELPEHGGSEAGAPTDIDDGTREAPPVDATRVGARAVDASGRPLVEARLRLVDLDGTPRPNSPSQPSGADGRTELTLPSATLPPDRTVGFGVRLALFAPGRASAFLETTPSRGELLDLGDVVLEPGGSIAGTVVDEDGEPVPLVRVYATPALLTQPLDVLRQRGVDVEVCHPVARCDEHGRFALAGLPTGEQRLWTRAPDHAWNLSEPIEVRAFEHVEGFELRLEPPPEELVLAVRVVTSEGSPATDAEVHLLRDQWDDAGRLRTDAFGEARWVVSGLGVFDLRAVDTRGLDGPSAPARWAVGDGPVELALTEPRTAAIRVVDQEGEPVEGATVTTRQVGDPFSQSPGLPFGATDAAGRVELVVPPESPVLFAARPDGYAPGEAGPLQPDALPGEIAIELASSPELRGVVLAGGRPISGATIELCELLPLEFVFRTQGFPQRFLSHGEIHARSDANGEFVARTSGSGRAKLLVEAPGWALAEVELELDDALDDVVTVELVRGGSIEGVVTVPSGESPRGLVVALSRGDSRARSVRTDDAGSFRVDGLTPGPWRVETRDVEPASGVVAIAHDGDDQDFAWNCEVVDGVTSYVELELATTGDSVLEGLYLVDGAPAAGWSATVERRDYDSRARAIAPTELDASGRFELHVPQDDYELTLRSPVGAAVELTVSVQVEVEGARASWSGELRTASLRGAVEPGARLRAVAGSSGQAEGSRFVTAVFTCDEAGAFAVGGLPVGEVSLQQERVRDQRPTWILVERLTLLPGRENALP